MTCLSANLSALAGIALTGALSGCARGGPATEGSAPATVVAHRPLVIAHRGASCHRPEHTLEAYALAIAMGADFIEPDLVSTRDGILVARHENEIGGTTDVAAKHPERRTTKVIDGDSVTGWFVEDLTAAEVRALRAKERLASRSHAYDGRFGVPTFEEVLTLADSAGRRRGRPVGVYPETKHPAYFGGIGLALEPRLLASLRARGLDRREAPVFIQSFEDANLRALRRDTRIRLVQLVSRGDQVTPKALREIATYADGIGANTRLLIAAMPGAAPTSLVRDAHAAGLFVHVWTLRPERESLLPRYGEDPLAEVRELAALGVDGLFGDCPDHLVEGLGRR
jgi:glycerophosphoryl diester phosphodiesterase